MQEEGYLEASIMTSCNTVHVDLCLLRMQDRPSSLAQQSEPWWQPLLVMTEVSLILKHRTECYRAWQTCRCSHR